MKKIQPKLNKITPQQESEDLEASFNFLKKKDIAENLTPKISAKSAGGRGRPKKKAAVNPNLPRAGKTRLTIDLPTEIYETVNKHKEDTGQNFTHLIVMLLKKHFEKDK